MKTKHWFEKIPHAVSMLFMIIVFVTLLTYIIPAGEFKRILIEGRNNVIQINCTEPKYEDPERDIDCKVVKISKV